LRGSCFAEHKLSSAGGARGTRAKGGFFAIFDGHGGREAVNYLEKNFHKELEKQMQVRLVFAARRTVPAHFASLIAHAIACLLRVHAASCFRPRS
jgi:serine/threonine protein phosphatase PrpC